MGILDYARKRLLAVLDEISRVEEFEFPYKGSELALEKLSSLYRARLTELDSLGPASDPDVVSLACSLALGDLFYYLPLLGFIVRSTNVRNSFEVLRPLLRLAGAILEPAIPKDQRQTQLVLSSEWDYSPLIYTDIPDLPGFVLIGLPSPESSNPLLVPLAGHELGHSVWMMQSSGIKATFQPKVKREVIAVILSRWAEYQAAFPAVAINQTQLLTSLFAYPTWTPAVGWCLSQVEETFCDCLGLRLFGTSYLESFAYLLAPTIPGERSRVYPNILDRVTTLVSTANTYGVTVPADYLTQFQDQDPATLNREDDFRLLVADQARRNILPDIVAAADGIVTASGHVASTAAEASRIVARYRFVVPAENCQGVADILNAAWQAFRDDSFWQNNSQIAKKKDEVLKELVLKNIELFEIEQILKGA